MRRLLLPVLAVLLAVPALAADGPKSEEQKTLYAVGLLMARQLSVFSLTPAEFEIVTQGLMDAVTGKPPLVDLDAYRQKTQELATARRDAQGKKLAVGAKEFLENAVQEAGALKTGSGLVYVPLREGSGISPTANDKVRVNYRGTLVDGKEFDSSYERGQPAEFPLNAGIKCWSEGLPLMKAGGRAKLVCPPEIAFGSRGSGLVPANAIVVYEVELLAATK